MKKMIFAAAIAAFMLSSCSDDNKFSINGTIDGASEKSVILENSINGYWVAIDSAKTDAKGRFEIKHTAPSAPQIYRLSLGDKSIYFPIDSLEKVSIKTTAEGFSTDYELSGSEDAVNIMSIDNRARELSAIDDVIEAAKQREAYKHDLAQQILVNPSGILAYYIINKQINGVPLFDSSNSVDLRIIGAVANAYNLNKPNDPRTTNLVSTYIEGKKASLQSKNLASDTMYVDETKILEIQLPDEMGKVRKLSDVANSGKVVVLNFTTYEAQESPAFNKILSDIYNANKGKGLEIYQIGFDTDVVGWKAGAQNLPWITVYDEAGLASRNLSKYNVQVLPTIYLIDRNGEIAKRITDLNTLRSDIQKLL